MINYSHYVTSHFQSDQITINENVFRDIIQELLYKVYNLMTSKMDLY